MWFVEAEDEEEEEVRFDVPVPLVGPCAAVPLAPFRKLTPVVGMSSMRPLKPAAAAPPDEDKPNAACACELLLVEPTRRCTG